MVLVMEAFDGRFLDCAVHALDLTIRPRMFHFGQPMLDAILVADAIEDMAEIMDISRAIGELDAVVRQHGMDCIGDSLNQIAQELGCGHLACLLVPFDIGKLRRSVDGNEEIELAVSGLNLGDIDVKIANRVGFECLLGGLVTFDIWQSGYAVALQAPVQRRARQARNG